MSSTFFQEINTLNTLKYTMTLLGVISNTILVKNIYISALGYDHGPIRVPTEITLRNLKGTWVS